MGDAQKESEREAALKSSLGELESKNKEVVLLQKKSEELEQKLQVAQTKAKVSFSALKNNMYLIQLKLHKNFNLLKTFEPILPSKTYVEIMSQNNEDATEIKSRDIGATISTPTKRKSKKKLEAAAAAQTSSSSEISSQHPDVSPAMNFKFIIGIALVSVIIGVILGKRY